MRSNSAYAWLSAAVEDGGVVVTASRRLARELSLTYNQAQISNGAKSWPTAPIYSWQAWLSLLFDGATERDQDAVRVQNHSSSLLWEQSLNAVMQDRIQNRAGFVRQCADTWQRMNDWCLSVEAVSTAARYSDERLFARAAMHYQKRLAKDQLVDSATLADAVANLIHSQSIMVPERILLAGFDRLLPAVKLVAEALRSRGCILNNAVQQTPASDLSIVHCGDADAELRAAGAWARTRLDAKPNQRIAIVCTELERNAARVGRLVREGFVPGWQYAGKEYESSVNVSYGQRLSDYPAIAYALSCLKWTSVGLTSREVSVMLRCRGAGSSAMPGRCRLELRLRRYPDRSWSPAAIVALLGGADNAPDAAAWLDGVRQIAAFRQQHGGSASPSEWAQRADELLQAVGWSSAESLDSAEFQLVNRWRKLLNEFSAIELVVPRINLHDTVHTISSMASEVVFQVESGGGRVQVLGGLEAAGLEFDAIWIAGVDSSRWPPAAAPLPLVSRQLQREYAMPDSSPNDTLEFSARLLDRLRASAGTVVISWARAGNDTEQSASQLLARLDSIGTIDASDPGWHASSFAAVDNVERVALDAGPPHSIGEKVQGGAYTVQRQNTEPFSAFAYGRLGIQELIPFESGIPARSRGTIVHRGLHALYADHPDLQQIRNWDEAALLTQVSEAAGLAIAKFFKHANGAHRRLIELERERLCKLLLEFVGAEIDRPEFSVDALECNLTFEHAGVALDLQVDRVDTLEDGTMLIADYKTGATKSLLNKGGTPNDLQLVVYSCALSKEVGGLALINVDSKAITYKGTGASTHWHRPKDGDWQPRLTSWQQQVFAAMEAISDGDIRLNVSLASDKTRSLALLSRIEEVKLEL